MALFLSSVQKCTTFKVVLFPSRTSNRKFGKLKKYIGRPISKFVIGPRGYVVEILNYLFICYGGFLSRNNNVLIYV